MFLGGLNNRVIKRNSLIFCRVEGELYGHLLKFHLPDCM